jgi:purine-nucleoside phosphorylase
MNLFEMLEKTTGAVRARSGVRPSVGIILGSGLGAFADLLGTKTVIPYAELPGFPTSSVPGHAGRLVLGEIGGAAIVAMQGRVHLYEGYESWQVAFPARVLCGLGIHTLVVTNAAGGIRLDLQPGDLMRISDHMNLSGANPLSGPNDDRLGPRFPDMSTAYDLALGSMLAGVGERLGVPMKNGVYAQLAGPSYETPAEIRMLRAMGADAVGMSTVPEVVVAAHMGVRCAGISCITNLAAGISKKPLSHAEVAETAEKVRDRFTSLLAAFLPLAAQGGPASRTGASGGH